MGLVVAVRRVDRLCLFNEVRVVLLPGAAALWERTSSAVRVWKHG